MIYIIVLNYKTWEDTIECLESLFQLDYPKENYRVIMVDNASPNDSMFQIESWARGEVAWEIPEDSPLQNPLITPKPLSFQKFMTQDLTKPENMPLNSLILIQSEQNGGYAAGNNIGIRYALQDKATEYIWILNNDVAVEPKALTYLMKDVKTWQQKDPKYQIFTTKLMYYDNPQILQALGCSYNKFLGTSGLIGNLQLDKGQYDNFNLKPFYPNGASIFVSKQFIQEVGLFQEDYFLYYEETDWIIRGREKKIEMGYSYQAKVYHREGSSISGKQKKKSLLSDVCALSNRIIITKRFFSMYIISVYLGFLITILNRLLRLQWDRVPMVLRILFNPEKTKRKWIEQLTKKST